jgi:hypothetical protein
MPTYRCFCLTTDSRIITGANVEAPRLSGAIAAARLQWQEVPRFHSVEVWQGDSLLYPQGGRQTITNGQKATLRRIWGGQ